MAERQREMAPLALSMGEPGGIGPDITLLAWQELRDRGPAFCVVGSSALMRARAAMMGQEVPITALSDFTRARETFPHALPVLDIAAAMDIAHAPGAALPENAAAVVAAIDAAVELVVTGKSAGLCTLPIQKESLYRAGFAFEGHTDYLAEVAQRALSLPERPTPVMMLVARDLRAIPITVHIALEDIPTKLSTNAILSQGKIVAHDLRRFFGIAHPRLAVAGLNPHAGEGGRMGRQEATIIRPAIARLREAGIDAFGPLPADTMFHEEARARYDAALCMYHDQALIPVKTLDFHGGVNVTLGLPFARTSPDHGTALSLAGTGKARPNSLIAALRLADRMARAATRRDGDGA